jgi:hypothetical protein
MATERFQSFSEFYPYYLTEHKLAGTRIMHFIGTTGLFYFLIMAMVSGNPWLVFYGVICGYGFAWVSHFFIEKNKPATFQYPLWSLLSDFKLYFELIIRKEKFGL